MQADRALRRPSCRLATESPTSLSYAFFVLLEFKIALGIKWEFVGKVVKNQVRMFSLRGGQMGDQRSENDGTCLVCPLKPTRMNVRCLEIRTTEVARHVFKKR